MEVLLFTGLFFLGINCRWFHGLSALRYSFQILILRLLLVPRSVCFVLSVPEGDYHKQEKRSYHGSGSYAPTSHFEGLGSITNHSLCDLCWTVWHGDKFISKYFCFPLSVLFNSRPTVTRPCTTNAIQLPQLTASLNNTHKAKDIIFFCCIVHSDICRFHSPTNALLYLKKKHIKICIKIHINITPTYFGLRPSSGSLHCTWLNLYLC